MKRTWTAQAKRRLLVFIGVRSLSEEMLDAGGIMMERARADLEAAAALMRATKPR